MATFESPIDLTSKLLSFLEEDACHWELAAKTCKALIDHLPERDRAMMSLNVAVYLERAALHREFVAELSSEIERS